MRRLLVSNRAQTWLWGLLCALTGLLFVAPAGADDFLSQYRARQPGSATQTAEAQDAGAQAASEGADTLAPWAVAAEALIDQHRKRAVNIVVLDEDGNVVPGAKINIRQQSHDFVVGCLLPSADLSEATLAWIDPEAPVWRVFNGVSLERLTAWRRLEDDDGKPKLAALQPIDALLTEAAERGFTVRAGPWMSGDWAQNPERLVEQDAATRTETMSRAVLEFTQWLGPRVASIDLYGDRFGRDGLVVDHGLQALRRLLETARVSSPNTLLQVRYRGGLKGRAATDLYESVLQMQQAFVLPDRVSVEAQVDGLLIPAAFQRDLDRLDRLPVDVDWVNLEAGGVSPEWAAKNLETVLRLALAQPKIRSVWLGGMTPEACLNPHAALWDQQGAPTVVGMKLDRLLRETWWDQIDTVANHQGGFATRLFYGAHQLNATFPDGRQVRQRVRIASSDDDSPRWVLLQLTK